MNYPIWQLVEVANKESLSVEFTIQDLTWKERGQVFYFALRRPAFMQQKRPDPNSSGAPASTLSATDLSQP